MSLDNHQRACASLLDLPTELLLAIVAILGHQDVLCVSWTNSQLRAVAVQDENFFFSAKFVSNLTHNETRLAKRCHGFQTAVKTKRAARVPVKMNLNLWTGSGNSSVRGDFWNLLTEVVVGAIADGTVVDLAAQLQTDVAHKLIPEWVQRAPKLRALSLRIYGDRDGVFDNIRPGLFAGHAPVLRSISLQDGIGLPSTVIPAFTGITHLLVAPATLSAIVNLATVFPAIHTLTFNAGELWEWLDGVMPEFPPIIQPTSAKKLLVHELPITAESVSMINRMVPALHELEVEFEEHREADTGRPVPGDFIALVNTFFRAEMDLLLAYVDGQMVIHTSLAAKRPFSFKLTGLSGGTEVHADVLQAVFKAFEGRVMCITLTAGLVESVPSLVGHLPELQQLRIRCLPDLLPDAPASVLEGILYEFVSCVDTPPVIGQPSLHIVPSTLLDGEVEAATLVVTFYACHKHDIVLHAADVELILAPILGPLERTKVAICFEGVTFE